MRRSFSRRLKYALAFVILTMAVPVGVLAQGLATGGDWGSPVTGSSLDLATSPGGTVGGWAGMSVRWQARNLDEDAMGTGPDFDAERTNLPDPVAVSTFGKLTGSTSRRLTPPASTSTC